VRVFKDYDSSKTVTLHTAFRALSDFVPSTRQESGLIAEWQQTRGHLIVGGNSKTLRIWDASKDALISVRFRVSLPDGSDQA
jgi:regulator-associated protein of mTOR